MVMKAAKRAMRIRHSGLFSRPSLVILEIGRRSSHLDSLQVLEAIKREHPQVQVVMISDHGTIEISVAAIRIRGAYDFTESFH
ncbi:Nitrogen regulation protein NtrX [invertebrate metagenome]|uniref:Nitrogen regulation protein NtrX n=1 Tax=invertebrate metagenome TaxID=1711999 RepID=A0A484H4I0_9ZZZZ